MFHIIISNQLFYEFSGQLVIVSTVQEISWYMTVYFRHGQAKTRHS